MTASAGTAGATSDSEREQLEAKLARRRIIELELDPVRGTFDGSHLREVNRRVFQDFPGHGLNDVTPGQYRPEVPDGQDWLKNRSFTTFDGSFLVAYSSMGAASQARIEAVLADAKPWRLSRLGTEEFTRSLAKTYSELDYLHPFHDGNSRTLRTFTRQLARAAGYDLDWERFNVTPHGRDSLYVARDLSVNEIALPKMSSHRAMVGVSHAMHSLAANANLEKILEGAIQPLSAIARHERDPAATRAVERPEAVLAREFERALEEKAVPESLRPQLRKAFQDEVQARVAKGEVLLPNPGRTPGVDGRDLVDPTPGQVKPRIKW